MKFRILLSLIFLGLFNISQSQDLVQTIKGTIIDNQSQFPLYGATVQLLDVEPINATVCDFDGRFKLINVPVGRRAIRVSILGYEPVVLSNLVLTSGKELDLKIEMTEQVTSINTVKIEAEKADKRESINKMATVSTRTFSIEEAGRYSGTLQDPARMAQNYAGVSGASDDRNDIIIRGNSPLGVLWRLEGVDIPSPNHFSTLGNTGGPISMLNLNNLSNSDFATSAWSANYGNALSGVFDLSLRNGNTDKREYLGQIGFNGFEIGAEGPFKTGGRASYMANYRYSTLGVFNALGLDLGTGAAVPNYQDLTFKLNMPSQKMGKFSIWGMMGKSDIDFEADEEADNNLFSPNNQSSRFESATLVIGSGYTKFIDEKSFIKMNLAYSNTNTTGFIDQIDFETLITKKVFGADRSQEKMTGNMTYNRKFNSKNTLTAGIIGDRYRINTLDSTIVNLDLDNEYMQLISDNEDEIAFMGQSFINWQHKFNDRTTLNSGIHSQHFDISNSHSIEPRLGLKYKLNETQTLSIGAGMHSQIQPITVYFVDEYNEQNEQIGQPNLDMDFSRAIHSVLAYDLLLGKDFRIKSELYYQYIYNAPVESESSSFSMLNEGVDFLIPTGINYVNRGTGSNYGLELTLEKFYTKGYYLLLTTSLFDSQYEGSDDVQRNTVFNGQIVSNFLGGKEFQFGEKNIFSIDGKFTYSGGRRYTPIDFVSSGEQGREIRFEERAFESQYDPYIRGDIKFSYTRNGKKMSQKFSLDIQNVSNQQNIFLTQYDNKSNTIVTQYQRGFFPVFLYQVYF